MDSVTTKWLLGVAGLACSVGVILYGFKFFDRSRTFSGEMATEQEKVYTRMEEYPITRYDGYYINGSTACGYIRTVVGEYEIPASVTTDNGTFDVIDDTLFLEFRNPASDYYINPLKEYMCCISRDENGVIQEVTVNVKTP